jgi:hypothetical protein
MFKAPKIDIHDGKHNKNVPMKLQLLSTGNTVPFLLCVLKHEIRLMWFWVLKLIIMDAIQTFLSL